MIGPDGARKATRRIIYRKEWNQQRITFASKACVKLDVKSSYVDQGACKLKYLDDDSFMIDMDGAISLDLFQDSGWNCSKLDCI